ncbi:MAG: hypothetical protein RL318_3049 [Fibrobacterota bacterium]|jgi:hypothetical protein
MRILPLRLALFLVVGLFLLWLALKSRESKYGGPARYEGRGSNSAAWEPWRRYSRPTPEAMLAMICRFACKDSTWKRTLLPEDNFRHMLASLNDPSEKIPPMRNPEKVVAEMMYLEEGVDLRGKIDGKTTLSDILKRLNELPHPAP